MAHSPQPHNSEQEHSGTMLETDHDILIALNRNKPAEPGKPTDPVAAAPKSVPPPATAGVLYRPILRPSVAMLTVFDDGQSDGEIVRVRAERFIIGRSEGDLLIPHDALISPRHVEISRQRVDDRWHWTVADLKSATGLFVRSSRAALTDQAEFRVGSGRYRFDSPSEQSPATADQTAPGARHAAERRAPGQSVPHLVELSADGIIARVALTKNEFWIGSDPDCAICRAADPFVEPRHVRLFCGPAGDWHAQNNKTVNGLWLRVPRVTVTDGCLFQIGEQRFRLRAGGHA